MQLIDFLERAELFVIKVFQFIMIASRDYHKIYIYFYYIILIAMIFLFLIVNKLILFRLILENGDFISKCDQLVSIVHI